MGNEIAKKYDFPQVHNATAGHKQLWKVYPGLTKDTRDEVSLWILQKDDLSKRKPIPIIDKPTLEQLFQILRKDIAITKDLNHTGILRIIEVFEENRSSFAFATERVVCSLADLMSRFEGIPGGFSWHAQHIDDRGALTEMEVSRGLLNVAEGLLFLHNVQRRLHLNVSPENIVITPGGLWKLCGFGFSLAFQPNEYQIASPYFLAPPCKFIPLEPDINYISPELAKVPGGGVAVRYATGASDFFSLGVTAYECYRFNLHFANESKPSVALFQSLGFPAGGVLADYMRAIERLTSLDMTAIPSGVTQLVLGMLQHSPSSRVNANDFVNNAYFHSGPMAILRSLDTLHTRDPGSQASVLTSLPQQISVFPPRILGLTMLAAVGRSCLRDPGLWVYALPLVAYISERIELPLFQRIAGPHLAEGLAVTHPPECMQAFLKHLDLLQDKFDIEFFRIHVLRQITNCLDKAHPTVQIAALTALCETKLANAIDKASLENEVVPRICREACKAADSAVRVKALYCMSLIGKRLSADYLIRNFLPSLKYIAEHHKTPAVCMCIVGVYEAITDVVGVEAMAGSILPVITPFLADRTFTRQQFQIVSQRAESIMKKVLDGRRKELGIPVTGPPPAPASSATTSISSGVASVSSNTAAAPVTQPKVNEAVPLQPSPSLPAPSLPKEVAASSGAGKSPSLVSNNNLPISSLSSSLAPTPAQQPLNVGTSNSTTFANFTSQSPSITSVQSNVLPTPSTRIQPPASATTGQAAAAPIPVPDIDDFLASFNKPKVDSATGSSSLSLDQSTVSQVYQPPVPSRPRYSDNPSAPAVSAAPTFPPYSQPAAFPASFDNNAATSASLEAQILATQRQIQQLSGNLGATPHITPTPFQSFPSGPLMAANMGQYQPAPQHFGQAQTAYPLATAPSNMQMHNPAAFPMNYMGMQPAVQPQYASPFAGPMQQQQQQQPITPSWGNHQPHTPANSDPFDFLK